MNNAKVKEINWAGLMVENFDSAVKFFTNILGMQLGNLYKDRQVAQFRLASGKLFEVFGPKNRERKEKYRYFDGVALGFEVSNLEKAHKKLSTEGIKLITDVESSSNNSWVMFLGPEKRVLQVQQSTKLGLKNISFVSLYASNLPETVKFYRDILQLDPANPDEDPEKSNWYSFKTGDSILAIERGGVRKNGMKTRIENPFLLQFKVESKELLEAMNKRLEDNGVKLYDRAKKTSYGLITNFCDPDGNKVEIIFQ